MGRPKEHNDETKAAWLSTAGRILQKEGPAALSVRRLAAETGTSTRAIYSLFGNKEGFLSAMYREVAETMTALHDAVPAQDDIDEELLQLCFAYREGVRRHPALYPLIFGSIPEFIPSAAEVELARRGLLRVYQTLERGLSSGYFQNRRVDDIGRQLWALVHGLASLELLGALGGLKHAEFLWRGAVTTFLAGLSTPEIASSLTGVAVAKS